MATLTLAVVFALLQLAKSWMAFRHARDCGDHDLREESVTVVQPVLSGDPLLEPTLNANLASLPEVKFLWMVDDDDHEAQRVAANHPRVTTVIVPGPSDGENPKLAKLIRALPLVTTEYLLVLDDDTWLPGESRLPVDPDGVVTGLPVFESSATIYERLVGGFVNGNALLTYLPAARLGLQRTINGMVYAVRLEQIRRLGGFIAAGHELTDDYAVARLFLRHGLPLRQSATPAFVSMTIRSSGHYVRVMRRWMIFANRYLGDNWSLKAVLWIGLPALLPLLGLLVGATQGLALYWMLLLLANALWNRLLLWWLLRVPTGLFDPLTDVVASLLTPLFAGLALTRPHRLTWRTRSIDTSKGTIRYR